MAADTVLHKIVRNGWGRKKRKVEKNEQCEENKDEEEEYKGEWGNENCEKKEGGRGGVPW